MGVLILVLVEDGLEVWQYRALSLWPFRVLILVLVEDGLEDSKINLGGTQLTEVLILVLVEDGLEDYNCGTPRSVSGCLNPCFSGRWS